MPTPGERRHPHAWVTPDDIESMDDLSVLDGRVHLVLRDGTCTPLLRRIELCDGLPGRTEPDAAAVVIFGGDAA